MEHSGGNGTSDEPVDQADQASQETLRRELRIAPILTGGTSLAVWIGGVTAELYRLVNCLDDPRPADQPYRELLDLTDTRALVDVVTGTSAGGLNGVLLSTAWALHAPTSAVLGLRDTWLDLGSVDALLRSPNEKDPPSLLRGDEYFWPELIKVLDRIAAQAATRETGAAPQTTSRRRPARDVDLALTVTTMAGELTHRTDDIGQILQETHLDHTLRFDTTDFGGPTFGGDHDWSRRLGLAARTSASIPGVFEASYLPVTESVNGRPEFGSRASFSVGRWAVDGGVLANKPIGAARQRIIDRSAGAELRRVALYVNPTPSEASPTPADDPKAVPTLVEVATSAISAPHNIGVRHEIDDLRAHNDNIRRSIDIGRSLARVVASVPTGSNPVVEPADRDPVADMAAKLYPQFRYERARLSVHSMLDRLGVDVADPTFPRGPVQDALIEAARSTPDWLPVALTSDDGQIDVGTDWCWGIAPLEYGAGLLLELIRRAYQLPVALLQAESRRGLGTIRSDIHDTLQALAAVRDVDSQFWLTALHRRPAHLAQWADRCYAVWPEADLVPEPGDEHLLDRDAPNRLRGEVTGQLWTLALALAGSARELSTLVDTVDLPTIETPEAAEAPEEVVEAAQAVADLQALVVIPNSEQPRAISAMVQRLVALHVVAVSLGDATRRHAPIELVEVSWRAANTIDPTRRPEDKLAGVEFSRLGAFVKRSWRANDWMWGRMDGASQLVRLLLDPRRLRQLGRTPDDVIDRLLALDPTGVTDIEIQAIRRELGFLDPMIGYLISVPTSLPVTTTAFVLRIQRGIARDELPEVYFAVLRSRHEGAGEGDGGDFRRAYETATTHTAVAEMAPEAVDGLFRRCRVGTETASGEVGEDLLTRTAGRAALVVSNMVTGERSGLRWPSRIARPFRQVAMLGYVLTRAATTTSRTGMAVTATLAALSGAIVAMFLLSGRTGAAINPGLVLLALTVLVMGLFLGIVRSGVVAALPALLALLVVALALMGSGVAQVVTGTADYDPDAAWRHNLFLGPSPIITIVIAFAALGWAVSALSRLAHARRGHRIDVRHALARGDDPPAAPWGPWAEVLGVAVVVPLVLVFHQRWLRSAMVGDDEGWRAVLIDVATWLGDRSVVMVLTGVVVFGLFFGLAWDRSFRRVLVGLGRRFR